MNKKDYQAFSETWKAVAEVSAGNASVSDTAIFFAFNSLKDFELMDVMTACGKHVRRCKFMITVADVVELLQNDLMSRVNEAWMIVFRAIETVGAYRTLDLSYCNDGEAIAYAIESEGWINMCTAETSDMKWVEKRFKERFTFAMTRGNTGASLLQSGLCDISNNGRGFQKTIPSIISEQFIAIVSNDKHEDIDFVHVDRIT